MFNYVQNSIRSSYITFRKLSTHPSNRFGRCDNTWYVCLATEISIKYSSNLGNSCNENNIILNENL